MVNFGSFQNRWTITGDLELETPLQIGGGQSAAQYSITTAPVIQRWNDDYGEYMPFIPGSSLKGAFRSTAERLIRSFDIGQCCCSLTEKQDKSKRLCGNCICCRIFGSMEGGAMVRVRDAEISSESVLPHVSNMFLAERPHFGNPGHQLQRPGKSGGLFRAEEVIVPGTRFSFRIDIDNAERCDVGLLLLTLDEFDQKRAFLGGSVSRGSGFVWVKKVQVYRSLLDEMTIKKENIKPSEPISDAVEWLESISNNNNPDGHTFDRYMGAHIVDDQDISGHEVVYIDLRIETPFKMPGVGEETVTGGGGLPVIPGSVIKGYLWRTLARSGVEKKELNDIFGDVTQRSRILCSDAYDDNIQPASEIPTRSKLRFILVMDNMTHEQKNHVFSALPKNKAILLTGMTSSRMASGGNGNEIVVERRRANLFRASRYLQRQRERY